MNKKEKKELIEKVEDMLFYEDSLLDEEKDLYSNLFSFMSIAKLEEFKRTSKNELIKEYCLNILEWRKCLNVFELEDDFEFCQKIMRCVEIEEREFKKVFVYYKCSNEVIEEFYLTEISELTKEIIKNAIKN